MDLGIFLEGIAIDQNNDPKKFVFLSTSLHLIHGKNVKPVGHDDLLFCSLETQRAQSRIEEKLVQDLFFLRPLR
jgi:hypothetical protein